MSNPTSVVTERRLGAFYQEILPYLGGSADAGFTPVGSVIAIMGVTAPANYLACNGQIVNVADYPELANYFEQQFGTKYKFGGSGTTFGIPDLRGEFLRGTGTNGHSGEGNGAAVGSHQNATLFPNIVSFAGTAYANGRMQINRDIDVDTSEQGDQGINYVDSSTPRKSLVKTNQEASTNGVSKQSISTGVGRITSRPTNTSILWCIATKNIYLDPKNDYSTEEKVIGKWIDGSTLYQKTINFGTLPNATSKAVAHGISNLSTVVNLTITAKNNSGSFLILPYNYSNGSTENYVIFGCDSTNITIVATTDRSAFSGTATIQYTKA